METKSYPYLTKATSPLAGNLESTSLMGTNTQILQPIVKIKSSPLMVRIQLSNGGKRYNGHMRITAPNGKKKVIGRGSDHEYYKYIGYVQSPDLSRISLGTEGLHRFTLLVRTHHHRLQCIDGSEDEGSATNLIK